MQNKTRNLINLVVGITLAVLLLWLFFKDADWSAIGEAFTHIDIGMLVFAYCFQLSSVVLKSWRWRMFLNPIKRGIPVHACWKHFNIGFATTTLLPGRVGEFIRPYLLSREEDIPFTATFATVVTERVLDLVMVLIMFASIFIFPAVAGPNPDDPNVGLLRTAALVVLLISLAALAFLILLRAKLEWAKALVRFFTRPLPKGIATKLEELVETFAVGVGSLSSWVSVGAIAVLTFVAWSLGSVFFWLTFKAFGFDLPFIYFYFFQAAAALGVAIPTPAGSGGFHGAVLLVSVSLWGLPQADMQALALLSHIIIFGSMTLIGVGYLVTGRINLFSAAEKATERAEEEA